MPYFFYGYDPYYWMILVPAMLIALFAQLKVSSTFNRYDRVRSARGYTGAQAAEAVQTLVTARTEQLIAMHISQEKNRPSLAVRTLAEALGATLDNEIGSAATLERTGGARPLHIRAAGQDRPLTIL